MKKKLFIYLSLGFLMAIIGLISYFYFELNHKIKIDPNKEFIVSQGQTTRQIAENLKAEKIISSAFVFEIYAKLKHDLVQVGVYKFSASENIKGVLEMLASGKSSEYLITFPEGWRITQIDELLATKQIIRAGDLLKVASGDEGYLFPDTYRILPKTSAREIRQMMLDNFKKKTAGLGLTREQLILASIIEREAKLDEDRPKIASVYLNRLSQGMRLEADPTVQYAKGSWEPITTADYHNVISPYNTYLYFGLPPGPICNPGLKSIEAALHPAETNYLYFFQDSAGKTYYSVTLEEHEAKLKQLE